MSGPLILYVVTAVVVAALFVWVAVVLVVAPTAQTAPIDAPPPPAPQDRRVALEHAVAAKVKAPASVVIESKPPPKGPVVVNLPSIRPRLDSHQEIHDSSVAPPVMDEEGSGQGQPLVLVAAVGRTAPDPTVTAEDAFAVVERHHLFALADAIGRNAGAVASQLGVEAVAASFEVADTPDFLNDPKLTLRANRLRRAVQYANHKIYERAQQIHEYAGMGTALAAVYFSPNGRRAYVAAVGEARSYRIRRGALVLLGEGKADAVGARERLDVAVSTDTPRGGDIYLLCSEGLANALSADELLACVTRATTLEIAATTLVERARRGDGALTALLVRVDEPKLSKPPPS